MVIKGGYSWNFARDLNSYILINLYQLGLGSRLLYPGLDRSKQMMKAKAFGFSK